MPSKGSGSASDPMVSNAKTPPFQSLPSVWLIHLGDSLLRWLGTPQPGWGWPVTARPFSPSTSWSNFPLWTVLSHDSFLCHLSTPLGPSLSSPCSLRACTSCPAGMFTLCWRLYQNQWPVLLLTSNLAILWLHPLCGRREGLQEKQKAPLNSEN